MRPMIQRILAKEEEIDRLIAEARKETGLK